MFNNSLLLISGADIPFIEGTCTIHQPTIYEISLIGEEAFFIGCELLKFSKDILKPEVKNEVKDQHDFHIFMSIIHDKSGAMSHQVSCAQQVLYLLFPRYEIYIDVDSVLLLDPQTGVKMGALTAQNFDAFKEVLIEMFCLTKAKKLPEYNAQGELAKKIADKLKQRQHKLAELSVDAKSQVTAIFQKYISILTVGEHKDMNSFMKYTVYQLFDEFQRYQLKTAFDAYYKARLAGAQDLTEPEDWMKDLHSDSK